MKVYYPEKEWLQVNPAEVGINKEAVSHAEKELHINNSIIGMMVVKDGYIVLEQYNPRYDEDTVSQTFSVTKSFISALFGIACSMGLIDSINDPVYKYFPEYQPKADRFLQKTVTLRHLLTMTAGLYVSKRRSFGSRIEDSSEWVRNIMELPISLKTANEFHYNDLYPHLISALISRQSGISTIDFANKFLFSKLNMNKIVPLQTKNALDYALFNKIADETVQRGSSLWPCDPEGIPVGGFGLMTTLRDMARFGYLYLRNGKWGDTQVIPEEWISESTVALTDTGKRTALSAIMNEKDAEEPGEDNAVGVEGYGYYWWISEGNIKYYCALGYGGQRIIVIPSQNIVIAIKTTYSGMNEYLHADRLWQKIVLDSLA